MTSFILADPAACIGCRTCEIACALAHTGEETAFAPRLTVLRLDTLSVPVMCHQCENAPCVGACPTGALTLGNERVEADAARCIACQNCVSACPFGTIAITVSPQRIPDIAKCDLCHDRERGPACIDVCPTGALRKITGDALAEIQKRRKISTAF